MWFGILGQLQVLRDGISVNAGPFKRRVLLAIMLCRANTVLSVDQLMEAVWDGAQPRTARKNLQVYLCALRKITGSRIQHVSYGYSIHVSADELDMLRFHDLAAEGRKAAQTGDLESARSLLAEALGLWRDRPLVDLLANSAMLAESDALTEQYLSVYEDWADQEIDAGRHLGVIEDLTRLTRLHPFRERLAMALMTALCTAGNRRSALAHYEEHRQVLARELGLTPSPVLQRHYQAILMGRTKGLPAAPMTQVKVSAKPAQLPRALPGFVGRAEQAARLVGTFADDSDAPEVALITGHPGTGKTALAVHVGHMVASRFADGQIFVAMRDETGAPRPWREILVELTRAAGLEIPPLPDAAEALKLWRSWIASRRFLIVLDDAYGESSTRRLLPGSGGNATIVTSCRKLCGLEVCCRIELGEFSAADALELLRLELGERRIKDAAPALRVIVDRCGALPLVIRAIAAKLTVMRYLSLAEYATQLRDSGDVLAELAVGGRSVRARLERFYRVMPPRQQQAFRALGSLPGPVSGQDEVLSTLTGLPEPAERMLEELMEASVLEAAKPEADVVAHAVRFEMPAATYHFCADLARGLRAGQD